jgi:predicted RNase H-like HicB family nuclease
VKYAVVYEQTQHNYAAYVPDLPGCVATGATRAEVERHIREAIRLHLELMRESGEPVPAPTTLVGTVDLAN